MLDHPSRTSSAINQDLLRTRKLVIAIGCSFTAGSAAWDSNFVEEHWDDFAPQQPLIHNATLGVKQKIAKKYGKIRLLDTVLDTSQMEYDNAYVNVLAKKYLNDEWTPANLGWTASGTWSAISKLFMYDINWSLAEKIVVIFMPTSLNRLDLINDVIFSADKIADTHLTLWPNIDNQLGMWSGKIESEYAKCIWSDKYSAIKFHLEMQILKQWVNAHNANLIVTPAFDSTYHRNHFNNMFNNTVIRNQSNRHLISERRAVGLEDRRADDIPWELFFRPQDCSSFFRLATAQETDLKYQDMDMFQLISSGKGSADKWIMPCGHPSGKAHELMAQEFYQHMTNKGYL
jgi:hypothetical protein